MIQPLDTSRNSWRLLWLDLEEPVPKDSRADRADTGLEYYLPTCLLVTTAAGKPLCPPEIMEELDQPRAEQLLGRLFDEHGTPDRLTIAESSDWDTEAWRSFAIDCRIEIAFGAFPNAKPEDIRQVARKITQRLQGSAFHSPAIVARGLVSSSRRLRSAEKKAAHLRKAIEQDADCADARIELADSDYQAGRWKECRRGYQELIEREERRWRGETPEWWGDSETRPLLRALYGRAMTEWQQGHFDRTAVDLQRIIGLNPVDNQGVRFLIPLVNLLADDDAMALKSFEEYERNYPDDYCEPALLFGKALALWRASEDDKAEAAYRSAMVKNLYITPLLLELPLPPTDIWHPNDRSDLGYAQDFMQSYATLWDRDPASLRFVREFYADMGRTLDPIVALRRQMSEWQDQRYARDFKERWMAMSRLNESLTGDSER